MLRAYHQLCDRVDRQVEATEARYKEQIVCRAGCAECCDAGLTIALVEAAALGEGLGLSAERVHLQAGQPPLAEAGTCALLDERERCRAYHHRPLVCRTQGMPLLYPDREGIVTCSRNFLTLAPHPSAVFDMENLETALFAANLDYCRRAGLHPLSRVAIDRLAQLAGLFEPASVK